MVIQLLAIYSSAYTHLLRSTSHKQQPRVRMGRGRQHSTSNTPTPEEMKAVGGPLGPSLYQTQEEGKALEEPLLLLLDTGGAGS